MPLQCVSRQNKSPAILEWDFYLQSCLELQLTSTTHHQPWSGAGLCAQRWGFISILDVFKARLDGGWELDLVESAAVYDKGAEIRWSLRAFQTQLFCVSMCKMASLNSINAVWQTTTAWGSQSPGTKMWSHLMIYCSWRKGGMSLRQPRSNVYKNHMKNKIERELPRERPADVCSAVGDQ